MPKISVITICWNAQKTIEATIQSVLGQKYPNLEYIIVDGGSTDGTLQIVERYKHAISKFISEPDKGISDAFNKGIRMATGDVVAILNADDTFMENTLSTVAQWYRQYPQAVVYGDMIYRDPETDQRDVVKPVLAKMPYEMALYHVSVFVPKSIYDRMAAPHQTYYDTTYRVAMDYDFFLRCMDQGVQFQYFPVAMGIMNKGGVSYKQWNRALREQARAQLQHRTMPAFKVYRRLLLRLVKDNIVAYAYRHNMQFIFIPYLKLKAFFRRGVAG